MNGIDATSMTRSITGESARRKGFAMRSRVVRSRIEEVEWISRGKSTRRLAVIMERTSGTSENSRRLDTLMSNAVKTTENVLTQLSHPKLVLDLHPT